MADLTLLLKDGQDVFVVGWLRVKASCGQRHQNADSTQIVHKASLLSSQCYGDGRARCNPGYRKIRCGAPNWPIVGKQECAGVNRHVGVSSEGWRIQWGRVPSAAFC